MHTVVNNQLLPIFSDLMKRPHQKYPAVFSRERFYLNILIHGPTLLNNFEKK